MAARVGAAGGCRGGDAGAGRLLARAGAASSRVEAGGRAARVVLPCVGVRIGAAEVLGAAEGALGSALDAGAGLVVLEAAGAGDGELFQAAQEALEFLRGRAILIVEGRPDIAAASGAACGALIPAGGLPPAVARQALGEDRVLAAAAEEPDQAPALAYAGAGLVLLRMPSAPEAASAALAAARRQKGAAAVPVVLDLSAEAGAAALLGALAAAPDGVLLGSSAALEAAVETVRKESGRSLAQELEVRSEADGQGGTTPGTGEESGPPPQGALGEGAAAEPIDRAPEAVGAPASAEVSQAPLSGTEVVGEVTWGALRGSGEEAVREKIREALEDLRRQLAQGAPDLLTAAGVGGKTAKGSEGLLGDALRALDEAFLVVVAGEFNSGKSTLINALLGKALLPSGVTPTTNEVSILRNLDGPGAEDAEKEREADGLFVWNVRGSNLLQNVNIVDTPGTNVVLQRQQRLTEDFVPRADLVLFVLSSDRPLSDSEVQFLEYVRQWDKLVVFAVNKKDLLSTEEELEEVLDFVKDNVSGLLGVNSPEVLPVSARSALNAKVESGGSAEALIASADWRQSNFAGLEQRVFDSLVTGGSGARLKLKTPLSLAGALQESLKERLKGQREAAAAEREAVQAVEAQLRDLKKVLARDSEVQRRETAGVIAAAASRAVRLVDDTVRASNSADLATDYVLKDNGGKAEGEEGRDAAAWAAAALEAENGGTGATSVSSRTSGGNDFQARVVQSGVADLESSVTEHAAWVSENCAQQLQYYATWAAGRSGVGPHLKEAAPGGDGPESGAPEERWLESREAAVARLEAEAARMAGSEVSSPAAAAAIRAIDVAGLSRRLEAELQEAVKGTAWLAGGAVVAVLLAVSFLDNVVEDALALGVGGLLVYLSFVSVPLKRSDTKDKIRAKAAEVTEAVQSAMEEDLRAVVDPTIEAILSAVRPLGAAAADEEARLDELLRDLAQGGERLADLELEVARLE